MFTVVCSILATDERAPRLTLQHQRTSTRILFLRLAATAVSQGELARFSSCLDLNSAKQSAKRSEALSFSVRGFACAFCLSYTSDPSLLQDVKDPKGHIFAKVQVLDDCGLCPKSKLPVLRLHEKNLTTIVLLKHIGAIAVIGAHPDPLLASQDHYFGLPWPRRTFTNLEDIV